MGVRVFWLILLRFLLVLISAGTLGCHVAQVIILGNREWWPKNYAYILYFVGTGVSILSSLGLVILTLTVHSVHGDRYLGLVNFGLMIATVVIGTLKSGPVPWLPSTDSRPDTVGFQTACNQYRSDLGLYQRCWLSNGMWLGAIILGALWLILVLYVFIQKSSDIYNDDDEYEVYDFKNVPVSPMGMAVTSHSPIVPSIKSPPSQHYHGTYYDTDYTDYNGYSQQKQQQQQQQHHYDTYDGGAGHRYYMPALANTSSIPTDTSSHYYPHDDTAHIINNNNPPLPHSPSNQVPHAYD
ncbi:hypothetical protein BC941DRAFT_444376 [Chlamydoabsidia padenii]|nr:hypothetical protein BC941DRAFT_444376 [Chlamydoabsidia padenii]